MDTRQIIGLVVVTLMVFVAVFFGMNGPKKIKERYGKK